MNDVQLIWESYIDSNLVLESLDKIQFYPYEKSFPFFDIYDRADRDEILHKRVGAFFKNKQGDIINTLISFSEDYEPIMSVSFSMNSDTKNEYKLSQSGDAVNVIATVLKIAVEAYSDFRKVMLKKHPSLWDKYLTSHRGVVGLFSTNPDNLQNKRSRVYKVVFDRLIKELCREYDLPIMTLEVRNESLSVIKTSERGTGLRSKVQRLPLVGKFF